MINFFIALLLYLPLGALAMKTNKCAQGTEKKIENPNDMPQNSDSQIFNEPSPMGTESAQTHAPANQIRTIDAKSNAETANFALSDTSDAREQDAQKKQNISIDSSKIAIDSLEISSIISMLDPDASSILGAIYSLFELTNGSDPRNSKDSLFGIINNFIKAFGYQMTGANNNLYAVFQRFSNDLGPLQSIKFEHKSIQEIFVILREQYSGYTQEDICTGIISASQNLGGPIKNTLEEIKNMIVFPNSILQFLNELISTIGYNSSTIGLYAGFNALKNDITGDEVGALKDTIQKIKKGIGFGEPSDSVWACVQKGCQAIGATSLQAGLAQFIESINYNGPVLEGIQKICLSLGYAESKGLYNVAQSLQKDMDASESDSVQNTIVAIKKGIGFGEPPDSVWACVQKGCQAIGATSLQAGFSNIIQAINCPDGALKGIQCISNQLGFNSPGMGLYSGWQMFAQIFQMPFLPPFSTIENTLNGINKQIGYDALNFCQNLESLGKAITNNPFLPYGTPLKNTIELINHQLGYQGATTERILSLQKQWGLLPLQSLDACFNHFALNIGAGPQEATIPVRFECLWQMVKTDMGQSIAQDLIDQLNLFGYRNNLEARLYIARQRTNCAENETLETGINNLIRKSEEKHQLNQQLIQNCANLELQHKGQKSQLDALQNRYEKLQSKYEKLKSRHAKRKTKYKDLKKKHGDIINKVHLNPGVEQ
jgi:hypothetical protein